MNCLPPLILYPPWHQRWLYDSQHLHKDRHPELFASFTIRAVDGISTDSRFCRTCIRKMAVFFVEIAFRVWSFAHFAVQKLPSHLAAESNTALQCLSMLTVSWNCQVCTPVRSTQISRHTPDDSTIRTTSYVAKRRIQLDKQCCWLRNRWGKCRGCVVHITDVALLLCC
jgi:hypothetical protein